LPALTSRHDSPAHVGSQQAGPCSSSLTVES